MINSDNIRTTVFTFQKDDFGGGNLDQNPDETVRQISKLNSSRVGLNQKLGKMIQQKSLLIDTNNFSGRKNTLPSNPYADFE